MYRFAHCQIHYEEVHAFLKKKKKKKKKRKWAPDKADIEVAGITWIEFFAFYDLTGNRSVNGQHQTNLGATKRAEKRKQKARCERSKKHDLNETTVVTKPSFNGEIKLFKAIVRHVTKHEAELGKSQLV